MVGLGDLPGGAFDSSAFAVSADGTVICGRASSALGQEAFVWTEAGGMIGLGDLPGGPARSFATAISPDGTVVVGHSDSAAGLEAFLWTAASGIVGLGDLPGGTFRSLAFGVSTHGNAVLCASDTAQGEEYALWTLAKGMQSLRERLIALGVDGVDAWSLSGHHGGISADGSVVAGYGTNPSGHQEGWVARIRPPAPPIAKPTGGSPPRVLPPK